MESFEGKHVDREELAARTALRAEQLPDDMPIEFGVPPSGTTAAYFPHTGTMLLARGAGRLTVLHEGAHAEHYRRLGIDTRFGSVDADARLGILVLSEAFVGRRLAGVVGFISEERSQLARISSTVAQLAARYATVDALQGKNFDGSARSTLVVNAALKVLPLVVGEQVTGNVQFAVDLDSRTGTETDLLLSIVASAAAVTTAGEAIFDVSAMRRFGRWVTEQLIHFDVIAHGLPTR